MGNKINISQLLKDCPKGMELYSPIFGTVYFEGIRDTGRAILIDVTTSCNTSVQFYSDGKFNTYYSESEVTLFPSKSQRDWSKFQRPFKVGDNIRMKGTSAIYVVTEIREDCYMLDDKDISLRFKTQDQWELIPNKFDINTLVPFESKVLVRDGLSSKWLPAIWGFYNEDGCDYHYEVVGGNSFSYCIPYEGNEHLRGTTDDCDDYYKTWE